ncbi:MAG TPA: DUF2071 domain-containing protein [Pirellulales bacterium]|nr:DUF2071 domain-containing protein [Pirellulales bacterium]
MGWQDLAFFHWPVETEPLARRLPVGVQLDTFEGQAWLGITPFLMTGVRPAYVPPVPGISKFCELNVRTYVIADGIPGIWFFSLDAAQVLAVSGARLFLNLPYHRCSASMKSIDGTIYWNSDRHGPPRARFAAEYRPIAESYRSKAGDLDHWFTERYCLYGASRRGRPYRQAIEHRPWPLQPAEGHIAENTMLLANGLPEVDAPPLVHFARSLDVWACLPESV